MATQANSALDQNIRVHQRLASILARLTTQLEEEMEERLRSMNHMFREAGATMDSLKPRMKDLQDAITQLDALFKDQIVQNVQVKYLATGTASKLAADNTYSNRRTLSLTDLTTQDSYKRC